MPAMQHAASRPPHHAHSTHLRARATDDMLTSHHRQHHDNGGHRTIDSDDDDSHSVTTIEDDEFDAILEAIRDHLSHTEETLQGALHHHEAEQQQQQQQQQTLVKRGVQNTSTATATATSIGNRHGDVAQPFAHLSRDKLMGLPPHVLEAALNTMAQGEKRRGGAAAAKRVDHRNTAFIRRIRERQRLQQQQRAARLQLEVDMPSEDKAEQILAQQEEEVTEAKEAYAAALRAKVDRQRRQQRQREEAAARRKLEMQKQQLEAARHHHDQHKQQLHTQQQEQQQEQRAATTYLHHLPKSKFYREIQQQHESRQRVSRIVNGRSSSNNSGGGVDAAGTGGRRRYHAHGMPLARNARVTRSDPNLKGARANAVSLTVSNADSGQVGHDPVNSWAITSVEVEARRRADGRGKASPTSNGSGSSSVRGWRRPGAGTGAAAAAGGGVSKRASHQRHRRRATVPDPLTVVDDSSPMVAHQKRQQQQQREHGMVAEEYQSLADWQQRPDLKIMRTVFGTDTDLQRRTLLERQQANREQERRMAKRATKRHQLKQRIMAMAEEAMFHLDEQDRIADVLDRIDGDGAPQASLLQGSLEASLGRLQQVETPVLVNTGGAVSSLGTSVGSTGRHRRSTSLSTSAVIAAATCTNALPRAGMRRRSTQFGKSLLAKPLPVEVGNRHLPSARSDRPSTAGTVEAVARARHKDADAADHDSAGGDGEGSNAFLRVTSRRASAPPSATSVRRPPHAQGQQEALETRQQEQEEEKARKGDQQQQGGQAKQEHDFVYDDQPEVTVDVPAPSK